MILSRSSLGVEGTDTVSENYDGCHQSYSDENSKRNIINAAGPPKAQGPCNANLLPVSPVKRFIRPHVGDYEKVKMSHVDMARSDLYRVGSVISPYHLVLQPLAFWAPDGWHNELQKFYDDADHLVETRIKTSRVYEEHLYIWKDSTKFGWCRVFVESVDLLEGTAIVNLVDEAVRKRVMTDDLYELSQQFWSFPSMGWKFRLHNIKPPRNQGEWSKAAVDRLMELCTRGDDVIGCVPSAVKEPSPVDTTVPLIIFRGDTEESVQNALLSSRLADRKLTYRWDKLLEEASLEDLHILETMGTQSPTTDTAEESVDFRQ